MENGTKAAIKAAYIDGLKGAYDWARGPMAERGLDAASKAADAALSGRMKLHGDVWFQALTENGVATRATMKELAALPD